VDPVGSCVGQKGVRVQAVTNEIGGERVDVIAWSDDVAGLIKSSLSPAEDVSVTLDNKTKTAKVLAPEDQLSMAIGKDGQNVRLTAKLTGFRIEVAGNGELTKTEEPEVASEVIEEVKPVVKKAKKVKKAVAIEPEEEEEKPKVPELTEKIEKKEIVTEDTQSDQNVEGTEVKSDVPEAKPDENI
jgi:N utilization substance protein A